MNIIRLFAVRFCESGERALLRACVRPSVERAETSLPSARNGGQKDDCEIRTHGRTEFSKSDDDIARLFAAGVRNKPRAEIARKLRSPRVVRSYMIIGPSFGPIII